VATGVADPARTRARSPPLDDARDRSAGAKWNNYQGRYHDMHVDVMDALSGFGASHRPIYDHVLDGDGPRVVEYCKLDTVETMLVFLAWGHHCGWVSPSQMRAFVDSVAEVLAAEPFAGWEPVALALSGWPEWAPRVAAVAGEEVVSVGPATTSV
jgi:hypothetical protein